ASSAGTYVPADSVLTDDKGNYQFTNLRPGTYRLRCQVTGGFVEFPEAVAVGKEAGNPDRLACDFTIAPFKKGTWRTYGFQYGLNSLHISDLYLDQGGVLWAATEAGVARFDGREFTHLTTKDGLPSDNVTCILGAPEGVLWFGTSGGLVRFDEH